MLMILLLIRMKSLWAYPCVDTLTGKSKRRAIRVKCSVVTRPNVSLVLRIGHSAAWSGLAHPEPSRCRAHVAF
jgi:hypothetical protein